jgi:glycine/D-amino acid oxidase-like deaminating enzyme
METAARPAHGHDFAWGLWATTCAEPAPAGPALQGAAETQVAIIGAGYLGLSTALALAENGVAVTVLEAEAPGHGASGRNGGQVIPNLRHDTGEVEAAYGAAAARPLIEFGRTIADATFALIARHNIACEAASGGVVQLRDTAAGVADAQKRMRSLQRMDFPVRWLDQAGVQELLGTRVYQGGFHLRNGGTVQPLALSHGLARAAQAAGARLHLATPATGLTRQGAGWRITTPGGRLDAARVLLATNALSGALWPTMQRALVPVWSYQVATAPVAPGAGPPHGLAIADARRVLRYFRADAAGRVVVGGKGLWRAPRRMADFRLQRATLARLYPALAEAPITHAWGGTVALTQDRWPRLFTLEEGLLGAIGCNGKGVAWNVAWGRHLAAVLAGAKLTAQPVPPGPARAIPLHAIKQVLAAAYGTWLRARDAFDRKLG